MTNDDHYQQRNDDTYNRNNQESYDTHFDQDDSHTAAIENGMDRPNVVDLQTTIGREDLPQMLQRFLR